MLRFSGSWVISEGIFNLVSSSKMVDFPQLFAYRMFEICPLEILFTKGQCQLISKGLFGVLNSSKKQAKKFELTTMIPQADLFLFVFLEEFEDTKKTFRN